MKIPEGRRNSRLTSIAGIMRARGLGRDKILTDLAILNERDCQPPLPSDEVERIANSVARYEPGHDPAHRFTFEEPPGYDRSVAPRCDLCGRWPGEHLPAAYAT